MAWHAALEASLGSLGVKRGYVNRMCEKRMEDLVTEAGQEAPAAVSVLAFAQSRKYHGHLLGGS